jgi:hypothetical protein
MALEGKARRHGAGSGARLVYRPMGQAVDTRDPQWSNFDAVSGFARQQ